jgi:hypothetical protein
MLRSGRPRTPGPPSAGGSRFLLVIEQSSAGDEQNVKMSAAGRNAVEAVTIDEYRLS